jgi:hypothetical protein
MQNASEAGTYTGEFCFLMQETQVWVRRAGLLHEARGTGNRPICSSLSGQSDVTVAACHSPRAVRADSWRLVPVELRRDWACNGRPVINLKPGPLAQWQRQVGQRAGVVNWPGSAADLRAGAQYVNCGPAARH